MTREFVEKLLKREEKIKAELKELQEEKKEFPNSRRIEERIEFKKGQIQELWTIRLNLIEEL